MFSLAESYTVSSTHFHKDKFVYNMSQKYLIIVIITYLFVVNQQLYNMEIWSYDSYWHCFREGMRLKGGPLEIEEAQRKPI